MSFAVAMIKLITALCITLGLMFLTFRFVGGKYKEINDKKYIKVIERVQVTKENTLMVVKMGKKGYVMTSSTNNMEKISELSPEELSEIEENQKREIERMNKSYNNSIKIVKDISSKIIKNIRSKEEKHEN